MAKRILIVIVALLFIGPYLWVEINTCLFKDDFLNCHRQVIEISETCEIKVYYKTPKRAKILYLTDDGTFFCDLEKGPTQDWELIHNEILWSRYGNASEFFYPFYRIKGWNT